MAALESLLKHFSRKGNEVTIKGANLHLVNGLGQTDCVDEEEPIPDCPNGLGNLIVGYNELRDLRSWRGHPHRLAQRGGGAAAQFLPLRGAGGRRLQHDQRRLRRRSAGGVQHGQRRLRRRSAGGQQHGQRRARLGQRRASATRPAATSPRSAGGSPTRPAALLPRSAGGSSTRPAGTWPSVSGGGTRPAALLPPSAAGTFNTASGGPRVGQRG